MPPKAEVTGEESKKAAPAIPVESDVATRRDNLDKTLVLAGDVLRFAGHAPAKLMLPLLGAAMGFLV